MNTVVLFLCLLLSSIVPRTKVVRETFDLVEVNHFYDENGKLVFDQCMWYLWEYPNPTYNLHAWRLVKVPSIIPVKDYKMNAYVSLWDDGDIQRVVYAKHIKETWTQYDPELVEREVLPKEERCDLGKVKK